MVAVTAYVFAAEAREVPIPKTARAAASSDIQTGHQLRRLLQLMIPIHATVRAETVSTEPLLIIPPATLLRPVSGIVRLRRALIKKIVRWDKYRCIKAIDVSTGSLPARPGRAHRLDYPLADFVAADVENILGDDPK
jgi:hypothetical protein